MGTLKLNKNLIKETEAVKAAEEVENTEITEVAPRKNDGAEIIRFAHSDGGFIGEIESLRGPNQIVYRRNDGTCRKVISGTPQFYSDGEGNLKEIRSALTDTGSSIENQANSFKLKFSKDGSDSKIFDLQKGGKVLTLSAAKPAKAKAHACGCTCELCNDGDNKVKATLDDGTEIEYVSLNDRVKENIIIRERQESYEYGFTLNIGELEVSEGTNNDLLLKDRQTGETEFRIPAPYMFDANNKRSDKVSYEVDVNGSELAIKVVADAEFINAEGRAFPVTIDPQIVISEGIFEFKTDGLNGEETFGGDDLVVYYEKTYIHTASRIDIKTELLPVIDKTKKIYLQIDSSSFLAYGKFSFGGITYDAMSLKTYSIDITDVVKNSTEDTIIVWLCPCYDKEIPTSISFYTSGDKAPRIIVESVDDSESDASVDKQPSLKKFNFGNGVMGYINIFDGSLCTAFNSLELNEFALPLNIVHFHKVVGKNYNYGNDWNINLGRKLTAWFALNPSETVYSYTDETGKIYYLEERYYYIENGVQKFVSKESVTVDFNGELSYDGKTVYKHQSCYGFTLIPQIKDFINSEYVEQRTERQSQLEDYVNQLTPTIKNYVLFNPYTCKVSYSLDALDRVNYDNLINTISETEIFVTKSETLQIESLYLTKKQLQLKLKEINPQTTEIENTEDDPNDLKNGEENTESEENYEQQNKSNIESQINQTEEQIALIIANAKANLELVKDTFIKYFSKQEELKLLKKQTPINFLRDNDGIINGFNEDGDLVLIADGYDNYVSIERNSKNQIISIYDSNNKVVRFDYENDLLSSITDNRGRQTKYEYEGKKLSTVKFADGKSLSFKYSSGYMRSVMDGYGIQTTFTRDSARNKFTKITTKSIVGSSDTLSTVSITYDESGTTFSYLDGSEERRKIDDNNRITLSYTKDPAGVTVTKEYSYENLTNGGRKVTCNERSNVKAEVLTTIEEYDMLSRLIKKETPWHELTATMDIQSSSIYEYDRNNNLISERTLIEFKDNDDDTNEFVKYKKYSYNANGSLVLTESYVEGEEQTSGINFEERVYNDDGNMVKCIRWNSLDSSSKFYQECDRAENGQLKADRGETGEISAEYEYVAGTDIVNSVKLPDGSKFAYGRNPKNFEVTSITHSTADGEANTTEIEYHRGLPEKVKSGETEIIYNYDTAGRKIAVLVNGVRQYSAKYALKTVYDTESETVSYGYYTETYHDTDGDITFKTEKSGRIDEDTGAYKVTERTYANKELVREISRNGYQEISSVRNGNLVSSYYRDLDNVLTDVETYLNGALQLTESFVYNDHGEVTQKSLTGAVGHIYEYAYKDNAARELESISVEGYTFKPLSDVNGRNTGREIYSGENKVAAEYITYRKVGDHATNMPATVWFGSGKKVTDSIKYKYDSCGNICEIRENGHVVAKYTYDSLNRLIREDNKLAGSTNVFTYDQNGNITERCEYPYTLKSGEELEELNCTHYSYDYEGDKLKEYNGEEFVYNNLGCPTTYRGKPATWIYGKLLASYNGVQFTYNGLGSRASKGGITFTYDSDGRLIKQSNGLEFIYDNAGVAGVKYNGKQYLYRKDAQGNIVAILTDSGAVVVKYVYDAWGNNIALNADGAEITSGIGVLNPFRYRGYYYDTETELYYLQTRYYDPELGRFISQDSLDYADPETINGLNLYAYCGDNPVMNIDPTGEFLFSFLIAIVAGAIVGGLIGGVTSVSKGDSFLSGFLSGALVGGVLGGAMILGGAAMLAVAGKAVAGIGVLTTFAAKAGFLIGTATISYVASVGAGMGAYAIQESMNGREINTSEMWRQGLNTGLKGLLSFGTGMMFAAAGAYPNLLATGKMSFLQTIKRSFDLFVHYGIPRIFASFILQTPWKILIK